MKKKEKPHISLPTLQLSKWTLIKGALAALLVRLGFYFLISLIFIGLLSWAGISSFSFRYVFVLTVGLFFFYVLFGKFMARY
jgi:hypothetical protein